MLNREDLFNRAQLFLNELCVQSGNTEIQVHSLEVTMSSRHDDIRINGFWYIKLDNFFKMDPKTYVTTYLKNREGPVIIK